LALAGTFANAAGVGDAGDGWAVALEAGAGVAAAMGDAGAFGVASMLATSSTAPSTAPVSSVM
jgi:hypothetical protein